jgi:hypothetical protein
MRNEIKIVSDGVCLYITSKIIAHKAGLSALAAFNILFLIVVYFVLSLSESDPENVKIKVLFLLMGIPIYLFTLGRYTAWNLWGEERIIINTKTISYQYSYGIIEPRMTTKKFNTLSIGMNWKENSNDNEHGELILYDYDENDLPIEIFSSTVCIKKEDLELINREIETLFINEIYKQNKFIPFSLN